MKNVVKFLIGLYLISAFGVWALLSKNASTNIELEHELTNTKNLLIAKQTENAELNQKIASARSNIEFLSLTLCPVIETSKEALCVKNSTEWFSQTIQIGTTFEDPEIKGKMEDLLITLGSKKRPTSKEFYELLKPIEAGLLKSLTENLK